MISWLAENIGTIVAAIAVVAVIVIAVTVIVKDRKKGKSSCGNNCAHCAMAGQCHKTK
jgi:hypothetical protein